MKLNRYWLTTGLLLATFSLFAQLDLELIPNGGFEELRDNSRSIKHLNSDNGLPFNILKGWRNPSYLSYPKEHKQRATPDFYRLLDKEINHKSVIITPYAAQRPSGRGMVGILVYNGQSLLSANYREYLSVCLKESLIAGEKYILTFDISNGYISEKDTSNYGKYGISNLGILLSKGQPGQEGSKLINRMPQLLVQDTVYTEDWKTVTLTFEADNNHTFLTIGNFNDDYDIYRNRSTGGYGLKENRLVRALGNHCYYFLDNISLQRMIRPGIGRPAFANERKRLEERQSSRSAEIRSRKGLVRCGEKIKLNKLLFDHDKFTFQPKVLRAAQQQLDIVVGYLEVNPHLYVEVTGHTNYITDVESRDTLLRLSQKRAETARDYLIIRGIRSDRIHAVGYGPDHPRSKSENHKNRRVEVEFLCSEEFYQRTQQSTKVSPEENTVEDTTPLLTNTSTLEPVATPLVTSLEIYDPLTKESANLGQEVTFYYLKEIWKTPSLEEEIGILPFGKFMTIKKVKRDVEHTICDGLKKVKNDWYKVTYVDNGDKVTGWIFGMNYINVSCY